MTEQLKQLFQSKLTDPAQAVQLVQNGDRVFVGVCTSVANVLCDALADRADDLEGLEICGARLPAQFRLLDNRGFRVNTGSAGGRGGRISPASTSARWTAGVGRPPLQTWLSWRFQRQTKRAI